MPGPQSKRAVHWRKGTIYSPHTNINVSLISTQDGSLYCFEQSSELKMLDNCKFDHPISSLAWATDYSMLAVGSQKVLGSNISNNVHLL